MYVSVLLHGLIVSASEIFAESCTTSKALGVAGVAEIWSTDGIALPQVATNTVTVESEKRPI